MGPGLELLGQLRIMEMVRAIQDRREVDVNLVWSRRVADTPAENGQLMGRFIGRVYIADLIGDDQKAAVYSTGQFRPESYSAPNMKIGYKWSQSDLDQLNSMAAQGVDMGELKAYIAPSIEGGIDGCWLRREQLTVAMLTDSFNYDRLGLQMSGVTWGMPSDLNLVPLNPWTDTTNGDAVNDILNAIIIGRQRYGKNYRRATMTTAALRTVFAQTKFQNYAKFFLQSPLTIASNMNPGMIGTMRQMLETIISSSRADNGDSITDFMIEVYDQRFWMQDYAGNDRSANMLPDNKVILTDPADDGKKSVWDFAKGTVVEGQLLPYTGNVIGAIGLPARTRGPIGWSSVPVDLDPPQIIVWAADRGWPRKKDFAANACLTIGPVTNPVPVSTIAI